MELFDAAQNFVFTFSFDCDFDLEREIFNRTELHCVYITIV